MKEESIAKELGLRGEGTVSADGSYVIDIESSDDFGKMYTVLDNNDELEYLSDSSIINVNQGNLIYMYDDYQIVLKADFNNDEYSVVITEV